MSHVVRGEYSGFRVQGLEAVVESIPTQKAQDWRICL